MNRHFKQAGMALLLAALLCLPSGCKKDKEESAEEVNANLPQEYTLGEITIPALTPGEEEPQLTLGEAKVFTYSGLVNSGAAASSYASKLTGEEGGFSIVDEELVRTDRPDFTEAEGEVRLAKQNEVPEEAPEEEKEDKEDKKDGEGEETPEPEPTPTPTPTPTPEPMRDSVQSVQITWSEGTCTVRIEEAPGLITDPPVKPAPVTMTLTEALDYLKSLPPAALGLTAASMEDYQIYSEGGIVWVDDQTCIRINVYEVDGEEPFNVLAGSYLLANDKSHLYQLDDVTHSVIEVPLDDVLPEFPE